MENRGKITPQALAAEILSLARSTLAVNFRFLDRALFRLQLKPTDHARFTSDGRYLYYEPWYILNVYRSDSHVLTRDFLHLLLHLIYRHGMIGKGVDRPFWDLATDIAVENTINEMKKSCLAAGRAEEQWEYTELLRSQIGTLTAEKIYQWLLSGNMSVPEAEELRLRFCADSHGIWYDAMGDNSIKIAAETREDWEKLSKQMETELEMLREDPNSPLVQNLRILNRTKYDYTKFLRRFGQWSETLTISDEEFDNNYYTYGLAAYGNMPLIEPLEYSERRRIHSFVIAVDTSGSVEGEIVQDFIQHTHDILMSRNSFDSQILLHIIQCDDRIREDALITSPDEWDRYIAAMEIKGLGQTDFRPVFSYVDHLVLCGKLPDLRGLIYFTDGQGTFPTKKPAYETAFILHTDGTEEPPVPVWATHMILTDNAIPRRSGK